MARASARRKGKFGFFLVLARFSHLLGLGR
jgi:hypothetical protein